MHEDELKRIERELADLWCERDDRALADRAMTHVTNLIAAIRKDARKQVHRQQLAA